MPRICPPGFICMSNGLILTFVGIAVACIAVLYVLRNEPVRQLMLPSYQAPQQQQQQSQQPTIVQVMGGGGGDDRYTRAPQPLRDWIAPPEFPPRGGLASIPINIPTQGLPQSFQSVGMLHADGKMLPVYGRRTTGSSDRWNYYTRTDTYNPIPIPLAYQRRDCMDDVGCGELSSGDNVHMEGTGQTGKVTLYKVGGPKYIPGLL